MSKILELKSIENFLGFHFLVKDYQRGYKWTATEVRQLLDDLNEFEPKENEFYCLQPIVIKADNDKKELIDGQQRCTTIYLILQYLGQHLFDITYQTREQSAEFLNEIATLNLSGEWNDWVASHSKKDNVDNYHFFQAYRAIQNWFAEKSEDEKSHFLEKLLSKTKVIWYEVTGEIDSIELFTRINSNKIPLTEAELIKALFLIALTDTSTQREWVVAQQWDKIENELEEDEFWYFITANIPPATPIDYIFSLSKVVKKQENYQGEYPIFNAYYNAYKNAKNKKQWVETQWNEVRNNFLTLKEWFKDFEYYHLVGALIHLGYNINTIFDLKLQSNSKIAFKEALKAEFTKIIGSFGNNLENVYYNSGKERKALLLFNIISILQSEENAYRFPFNKFKTMNWDIEHIHAIATDTNNKDVQKAWLRENKEYISGTLRKEIEDMLSQKEIEEEKLSSLVEKVTNELSEKGFDNDNINDISNLTLLDSGTNRSYKNIIFPLKRMRIIEEDKKGTFIPLCTKNVFQKYYTPNASDLSIWSKEDKENYRQSIITTFNTFVNNGK
ncbi:DUF262 domain-containing protein [Capnocytophaga endodontalis]|uniref:GmrSD restriction endonucleases N-terminal domain-containing protein n=1 Tax=Capnocytophaga endodontalis TaxID=2708117 RepID=A0A1Z4BRI3_9FLAO|nr:DUF262 domain-containing protein [Capnocytophaga endodontalis]ASF43878.1 hypothetical protein CBG49_12745 [Capnocytophaga endodontalis]